MIQAMTHHAEVRANQRGIRYSLIDAVLDLADLEIPVGDGCMAYRISKERLAERDVRHKLGGHLDRAGKVAVICGDDGAVVTVMHDWGCQGRRYRGRA